MVKPSPFNPGGVGSVLGGGAKIAHAHSSSQKTKTENRSIVVTDSTKTLKKIKRKIKGGS